MVSNGIMEIKNLQIALDLIILVYLGVACERYRSQSVSVIRIVVSGVSLATH